MSNEELGTTTIGESHTPTLKHFFLVIIMVTVVFVALVAALVDYNEDSYYDAEIDRYEYDHIERSVKLYGEKAQMAVIERLEDNIITHREQSELRDIFSEIHEERYGTEREQINTTIDNIRNYNNGIQRYMRHKEQMDAARKSMGAPK